MVQQQDGSSEGGCFRYDRGLCRDDHRSGIWIGQRHACRMHQPFHGILREDDMNRLWALYEHWCMEELISLREFILRLKGGEFGSFSRDDVVAFLREIEANMLENIELKAIEDPSLNALKDERMD